jgi:ribosomal protein L40E
VRQLNPHVSALAERVVIRAMELEPERRQQSATELERDLRAVRTALGTAPDAAGAAQPATSATIVYDEARQESTLLCQHCGGANPPVARHCMRCGWRLLEDAPALDALDALDPAPDGVEPAAAPATPPDAPASLQADAERANAPLPNWLLAAVRPNAARPAPSPLPEPSPAPVEPPPLPVSAAEVTPHWLGQPDAPLAATPPANPADGAEAAPRRGPVPAAMWLPAAPIPHARPNTPAPGGPDGAAHGPRWRIPRIPRIPRVPPAAWQQVERVAGRVAAFVASAAQPARRLLPAPRRWQAETLSAPAPLDEREVRLGVAAVMALVLAFGTLVAVRFPWALLAALPALALGHWCLRESAAPDARPVPEARWLALAALAVTYLCLGLFTLVALIHALHH